MTSVDVEAKLEDSGGVTVGLFAPEDTGGEHVLRGWLDGMKEMLMSFQGA